MTASEVIFYLNGERVVVNDEDPRRLLIDYLRSAEVGLFGAKKGCEAGGCGACTVMLSRYDAARDVVAHRAVSACLQPLGALDGAAITTTEGLGSGRGRLNPVQYAIACDNGSQCGFCTPGFVMSAHSFLASQAGKPVTRQQIEGALDGNICRCTGYRPIVHALRRFATDWQPAEDAHCLRCVVDKEVPHDDALRVDFPAELRTPARALRYTHAGSSWVRPLHLQDVYALMTRHQKEGRVELRAGNTSPGIYPDFDATPRIVIDLSAVAELRRIERRGDTLHVGASITYTEFIEALDAIVATLPPQSAQGLAALRYMASRTGGTSLRNSASLAGNTMMVVRHIEDGAPLVSDLFTALCAVGATIEVGSARFTEPRQYGLLEFAQTYARSDELGDAVLLSYAIPFGRPHEHVEAWKIARRYDNSGAIVNAAFRIVLDAESRVLAATLIIGGIGPSAISAQRAQQALCGQPWSDETLTAALHAVNEDIASAFAQYKDRMRTVPFDGIERAHRQKLVEGCFYKFFVTVAQRVAPQLVDLRVLSAARRNEPAVGRGTQRFAEVEARSPLRQPVVKLSAFKQAAGEVTYTHDIVMPKHGAHAAFVLSTRALGRFAYRLPDEAGPRPAEPDGLRSYLRERFPGFVDLLTARDIPAGGVNMQGLGRDEPLLCEEEVTCFGQPIGLVVATQEQLSRRIARFVEEHCVTYSTDDVTPILSIAEARERGSVFEDVVPPPDVGRRRHPKPATIHLFQLTRPGADLSFIEQRDDGEAAGRCCRIVRGSQYAGAQAHFYMETQACVAVPSEAGEMVLYPSSQNPDDVHGGAAATLGVRCHQIGVRTRSVGGGYGGKTVRSPFISSPAALAAWKLRRPMRLVLPREVDTTVVGKRHPFYGEYCVAVATGEDDAEERGRIVGLDVEFRADGGHTYDCSFIVTDTAQLQCDNAYHIDHYRTSAEVYRTHKASNTAFRGFGAIQAALIIEDALDAAAHAIGMSPEALRRKNLYRPGDSTPYGQRLDDCHLTQVYDYLAARCDFAERARRVEAWNAEHRFRKRGIAMMPLKYGLGFNATGFEQAGALIEIYAADGSVLVRHGGIEVGQGIMTTVAQIAADALNLPLDMIRVGEPDTGVIPNPTTTGASTSTSFNGGAVLKACRELRQRLEALCAELRERHGDAWCTERRIDYWNHPQGWRHELVGDNGKRLPMWCAIVSMAYWQRVNLSAQTLFRQTGSEELISGATYKRDGKQINHFIGFSYSAACSEVEIDVLTGEAVVLRTDIVQDVGESLNPALDIGQIEGSFVQGLGYVLTEEVIFQPDGERRGALNTTNFHNYKVPSVRTVPREFNVELLPPSLVADVPKNQHWVLSAKHIGEPPLLLAVSVYLAIKRAILAARRERGHDHWFALPPPTSPAQVRAACLVETSELRLKGTRSD